MRKWLFWGWVLLLTHPIYGQLSTTLLERAKTDLARTRELVEQGTLPRASLAQAEERLADAQDAETLWETLYSTTKLEDMTPEQANEMVAAATRRMERASARLLEQHKLLDMGIISQSEMAGAKNELYARQTVLDLARNRFKLLDDLHEMAKAEQRMEAATLQHSMIRYDGSTPFRLVDLAGIQKDFKVRFQHDLPVSAIGQTQVHQSMGLDHRNRVDVALNPEQPEGLWLRHYLEKQHLSYLAFRGAVVGAATAAHIHIGTGSSRLATAVR